MHGAQWNALEIEQDVRQHLLSPSEKLADLGHSDRAIYSRAEGIYVVDTRGRRLIDGPAGMWCTQVGYGRKEIAQAVFDQAMSLSYTSPWYSANPPSGRLAASIAAKTPGDLNRVFFTTGGSTAVDSALRFAEFFNNLLGRPRKKHIIVRHEGYHGSTHLTASCSGRKGNWPNFDISSDRVTFISCPSIRLAPGLSESEFLDLLVDEFRETVARIGPENVGVFLAEPLLASGGVIIPPRGYHSRILEICRQHDILYISDEVVTGFGRCGEWFASEKVFGIVPDIITFAKGVTSGYVPLGGMAISDALLARISGENSKDSYFGNGYTYSGHPVSCAAALANIEVIERDGILEHVNEISPVFKQALEALSGLPFVVDIRACGLVGCVECRVDDSSPEVTDLDRRIGARIDHHCFENGLIVRPLGHICVLSPPLIITAEEIGTMVGILRDAILRTAEEYDNGYFA